MDMVEGERRGRDYALERQILLSDGVFAIALTLLAIELKAPEGWDHTLTGLFERSASQFFAYGMSFFVIGISWAIHRQSYGKYRRTDFMLTLLGLLTLGFVTLIPFGTRLYSEDMGARGAPDGAVVFYLAVFAMTSVCAALNWGYACLRPEIIDPTLGPRAKVVVFVITLVSAPALTALGVIAGETRRFWLYLVLGVLGAGVGIARRWAGRADAAAQPLRGRVAHG